MTGDFEKVNDVYAPSKVDKSEAKKIIPEKK